MGRNHQKVTNFYDLLMQRTSYEITSSYSVLINSVNLKGKTINYSINTELFMKYADIIFDISIIEGVIKHKEITEILFSNIFKIYKTKIATRYVPFVILNLLVVEGIFYTDDGEDYFLSVNDLKLQEWRKNFIN